MITAVNGELYQVGSYIGATVSQGGGFRARIQQHDYETRRRLAGIITSRNTSKHYSFVGRHGVKEHNFIVAQMGLQDPKPPLLSFLLEAVLQAYLNVVEEAKDIKMWHRPAVSAFLGTLRASAASTPPDLSQFGLNTAWSLVKGVPRYRRKFRNSLTPSVGSGKRATCTWKHLATSSENDFAATSGMRKDEPTQSGSPTDHVSVVTDLGASTKLRSPVKVLLPSASSATSQFIAGYERMASPYKRKTYKSYGTPSLMRVQGSVEDAPGAGPKSLVLLAKDSMIWVRRAAARTASCTENGTRISSETHKTGMRMSARDRDERIACCPRTEKGRGSLGLVVTDDVTDITNFGSATGLNVRETLSSNMPGRPRLSRLGVRTQLVFARRSAKRTPRVRDSLDLAMLDVVGGAARTG
jgi:hypothetical protein